MDKELIKGLIAEYQQFVKSVSFVKRAVTLSDNFNYVFVGLRRVGKSYLMYQQIHHLIETGISPEEILFFNFEDERIAGMDTEHLDMIKRCYEEMYSHRPIFFLDEIQIVPHWEQFVRRLADQKYRVYVTGSNAKMLSKDIATTLGGRFMIQYVYPFSFREYFIVFREGIGDKGTWEQLEIVFLESFRRLAVKFLVEVQRAGIHTPIFST